MRERLDRRARRLRCSRGRSTIIQPHPAPPPPILTAASLPRARNRPRRYVADDRVDIEGGRPGSSRLGRRRSQMSPCLWGAFPQSAGGAPRHNFARKPCARSRRTSRASRRPTASTVHSLYRLNDLGIWGDSNATILPGYIDRQWDDAARRRSMCPRRQYGVACARPIETATIAGPGLAGVPDLACPTVRRSARRPRPTR